MNGYHSKTTNLLILKVYNMLFFFLITFSIFQMVQIKVYTDLKLLYTYAAGVLEITFFKFPSIIFLSNGPLKPWVFEKQRKPWF